MDKKMNRPIWFLAVSGFVCAGIGVALVYNHAGRDETPIAAPDGLLKAEIFSAYEPGYVDGAVKITNPVNGAVFPPDITAPTFAWESDREDVDLFLVTFQFGDADDRSQRLGYFADDVQWTPTQPQWEAIKKRSLENETAVTILGVSRASPKTVLAAGGITISTSKDEVGAPIFYRDVNLPAIQAIRHPEGIRWRFGSISSPGQPSVVLEDFPVCGNCHSFSSDGKFLGMDVDYGKGKGAYVITRLGEQMKVATSEIISWDNYRKEEMTPTSGLLSQVSPDGRYVISTVKDASVFIPLDDLAFSQQFLPVKGLLAVYDTQTETFRSLPGADDPKYVQSNPVWSPDGETIVFARNQAYDIQRTAGNDRVNLTRKQGKEFVKKVKPFRFDLYRIPFNGGEGGTPEPVQGASGNGKSNFFPKYSPDGRWIVFCQADSYMLLQPDSELFIIPAEGGEARRLRCNTNRMNSWHSWSPNSRWLVFSSKANTPYTQLFLTHIDEHGRSTVPVVLSHFTAADRAANIPEFVNASPKAIREIKGQFVDDEAFVRFGDEVLGTGDVENAILNYRKALQLNPDNVRAHRKLGVLLCRRKGAWQPGLSHLFTALRLRPKSPEVNYHVGVLLIERGQYEKAAGHLAAALSLMPQERLAQYPPAQTRYHLAKALFLGGKQPESLAHLKEALRIDPKHAEARYLFAEILARQGELETAVQHYHAAVQLKPTVDRSARLHVALADGFAGAGRFAEAVAFAERAHHLAAAEGNEDLLSLVETRMEQYRHRVRPSP